MNPDPDSELETRLRAMCWRPVPDAALAASLEAAQEALGTDAVDVGVQPLGVSRGRAVSRRLKAGHQLILLAPWPVRWTVAACWALSLALRVATPPSPAVVAAENTAVSVNGAAVFEAMQQTKKQIHEFERELALVRR